VNANVYIDGFNLYYCAVKNTSYKWLNLLTLCNILLPSLQINRIKYFSAKVRNLQHDPNAQTRQDTYWRALKTIPNLEIIEGDFVAWPKLMPQFPLAYVNGANKPPNKVQVERAEEKGSDVNLAAYLVYDNCMEEADESIVISNDSDLTNAIELVTKHLGRPVTVVNPNRTNRVRSHPRQCSLQQDLRRVSTRFVRSINSSVLRNAQFPTAITDAQGTFTKPPSW
jgi:uncharacterized LabA/DUF88 family protein